MLKRFLIILLGISLVAGATGQTMPHAMAMPMTDQASMTPDDSASCPCPDMPCKGVLPACIDAMGCLGMVAVPTAPISPAAHFPWGVVSYPALVSALCGLPVGPDLRPPILSA